MAKNKTTETEASVAGYLDGIADEQRRNDCTAVIKLITEHTGFEPKMWGSGIVGFGTYHYRYDSGHEGDAPLAAFSSRAKAISLYISDYEGREQQLARFGKHKTGKGCIYVQKLSDIDTDVLALMVKKSVEEKKKQYPG